MKYILPIAGMLCNGLATLMAITFVMSMGANASPAQIRSIKIWMAVLGFIGLAGIVASILLLRAGQANHATLAAFAPIAIFVIILIVALAK